MEYIKWITSSTTFVVPKAGKWKVICVGGGASGGVAFHDKEPANTKCLQANGGTTSFGSYLSATSGQTVVPAMNNVLLTNSSTSSLYVEGQGGFDGFTYGNAGSICSGGHGSNGDYSNMVATVSNFSGGTGHGYGAGGGAGNPALKTAITIADSYTKAVYPVPGACGGIKSGIIDLDEDEKVICTIGSGGVFASGVTATQVNNYILTVSDKTSFASYEATPSSLSEYVTNGASGVIVVQYLG